MHIFIKILAFLIYSYSHTARKTVFRNLRVIFGSSRNFSFKRNTALRFFEFQIYNLLEFLIMAAGKINLFRFKVEGAEIYMREKRKGNNISFLSAHFGNWELLGAWLSIKKIPLYSIILPPRFGILDRIFQFIRGKYNIGTIIRTNSREIFRKVTNPDYVVAFIIDQDGESSGIWTPFFGKGVSFPSGAAAFAARKTNIFIPVVMIREGFLKHRIVFSEPLDITGDNPSERKISFIRNATKYYEDLISNNPENWLLFYPRWQYRRHYPICRKNSL